MSEPISLASFTSLPDDVGISTFFWHIFKKKEFTDVEFNLETPAGSFTFSAHKMVMAIRSSFFADMFYGGQRNTDAVVNIITLQNVNHEAFRDMLSFMYDYTPVLETPKQACELFKVAARFQVTSLMNLCRQFLSGVEIVPSNVFHFLEVAESMDDQSLKDRCLKVIQEKTRDVLQFYEKCEVTRSMMFQFIRSPTLSLESEYEFIDYIFSWAKAKCSENSVREFLEKLLPHMHFLELENNEFAKLYRDHDYFFSLEEAVSIFMNIAIPGSKEMPDWFDRESPARIYTGSFE